MRIPVPDELLPAERLGRVHFTGIGGAALSGIARIMAQRGLAVTGSDDHDTPFLPALRELAYDAGLERVLSHDIGIWDVLDACHRQGSLDSAIRHAKPNDFASLREHAPLLENVCFNGKTAGRFADVIGQAGYDTLVLPSSSPANATLTFEQKLVQWRAIPD